MSQDIAKFLTKEEIESVIVDEEYKFNESVTICILRLRNGAKVVGVNYGAIDPERQDFQLGRQAARSEAVNKVWELEGYLLRQRLIETESTDNQAVFSTQDPKYSIQAGRIINTVSGVPIPYDEPIMIFRAKDCYASEHAIRPYTKALMDPLEQNKINQAQILGVVRRLNDFEAFAKNYPERMKVPDTTVEE